MAKLASDAHLVALVRQGWPSAFETVYARYHRSILSFARHTLGDADEAEDVVQHTFLAAYNDLISSEKPIQLRPWLFTIARNRCYSVLRARREHPQADITEPATEGLATQVQRRQDLRDLVGDLRELPDDQRTALVLAEIDALSHEEIGEVLGVPSKKVKALVFQARESLLASRTARDTACSDIREQIANGRGAVLRRANLRRHLRDCQGCRDFRRQVERQRSRFALVLPVMPTLALKDAILGATVGAGAAGGIAGGGFAASSLLKSSLVKGVFGLILAGAGAGTLVASHDFTPHGEASTLIRNPQVRPTRGAHATASTRTALAAATTSSHTSSTAAAAPGGIALAHPVSSILSKSAPALGHARSGAGAAHHDRVVSGSGGTANRHGSSGGTSHHAATTTTPATSSASNAPYLGSGATGSGAQTSAGTSRGDVSSVSSTPSSSHVTASGTGTRGSSGSSGGSAGSASSSGSGSAGSRGASNAAVSSQSSGAGSAGSSSPTSSVRGGGSSSSGASSQSASPTPAPSAPSAPTSGGGSGGGTRGAGSGSGSGAGGGAPSTPASGGSGTGAPASGGSPGGSTAGSTGGTR